MNIKVGRIFRRINENLEPHHRIIFLRGGARSGKSFLIMQLMTIWLYTGQIMGKHIPKGAFTVIRATFPALRATVLRDFIQYLHDLNIYQYIDHRKTINEFHYKGRQIDFIPADNPQKLRGRKHDLAWLEEINDMDFDTFVQVEMRLSNLMFMTVNPSGEPWGKTEIEEKRTEKIGDVLLDVSTYKDNPFLDDNVITSIKNLEHLDPDLFRIYNLGLWTKLKGLIYPEVNQVKKLPERYIEEAFGLDFGFKNYTSLVQMRRKNGEIYFREILREKGLLNDAIAKEIKRRKIKKVICDSAEPRSIFELRTLGVNATPAKKGADSVKQGINFIKQHKIFVTEDSLGLLEEGKRYQWKQTPAGDFLDVPVKKFDDSWDAARYSVNRSLGSKMRLL